MATKKQAVTDCGVSIFDKIDSANDLSPSEEAMKALAIETSSDSECFSASSRDFLAAAISLYARTLEHQAKAIPLTGSALAEYSPSKSL